MMNGGRWKPPGLFVTAMLTPVPVGGVFVCCWPAGVGVRNGGLRGNVAPPKLPDKLLLTFPLPDVDDVVC